MNNKNLIEELREFVNTRMELEQWHGYHFNSIFTTLQRELKEILEKHKHALILYPELAEETQVMDCNHAEWDNNQTMWLFGGKKSHVVEGNIFYRLPEKPNVTVQDLLPPEEEIKVGDEVLSTEPMMHYTGQVVMVDGEEVVIKEQSQGLMVFDKCELKKKVSV